MALKLGNAVPRHGESVLSPRLLRTSGLRIFGTELRDNPALRLTVPSELVVLDPGRP
jgi:hypothetical protein